MKNIRYWLFLLVAMLTINSSFAQTELQKQFLLKNNIVGMEVKTPEIRKHQLWSVTRVATSRNDEWTLKINKTAMDPKTQKPIDFGQANDRYIKFAPAYNTAKYPGTFYNGIIKNPAVNFIIMMNLHEKDGKFVKTISRWGNIIGSSESNWIYEAEGKYPILITNETVTPGSNFTYTALEAKKQSILEYSFYDDEIVLGAMYRNLTPEMLDVLEKELALKKARKAEAYNIKIENPDPNIEKIRQRLAAECPLFSLKFAREYAACVYYNLNGNINQINGFVPMKDCFTKNNLDWGHAGDRYLKFDPVWVPRRMGTDAALKDDVYKTGKAVVLALNLYEKDGTLVKCIAFGGGCMMWGPGHLFFRTENGNGVLFTAKKIKLDAGYTPNVYSYKAITNKYPADNLSYIINFNAYNSF